MSGNAESKSPSDGRRARHTHWRLLTLAGIWLAVSATGLGALMQYANRPGERAKVAPRWPSAAGVSRDPTRHSLLVFAHPKCVCTQATIDELAWIMTRCGERLHCRILFFVPDDASDTWAQTKSWRDASRIPGVELKIDRGARIAKRFGARTSGHVFLHAPDGRLLLDGGITPSRGHRGENSGRDSIVTLTNAVEDAGQVTSNPVRSPSTSVFGCPLFAPTSQTPASQTPASQTPASKTSSRTSTAKAYAQ